jgi:hypothetical protein
MNTCGTCRFWGLLPSGASYHDEPSHGFKTCGAVEHESAWDGEKLDRIKAHVEDGSDYWAALRCKKDFGCVLWEKKP